MGMPVGVDVSSYQPSGYATAGLDFAIVKCSESTSYVNPEYAAQLATARKAGLIVGHYHYATGTDSAAEAAYFKAHADVRAGELIAMDWEETSVSPAARDAFLLVMKQEYPHNKVVLYCDISFWTTLDTEHYAADGLWIADYSHAAGKPNVAQPWVIHQYSSSGGIDHNVANFASKAAFEEWASALNVPAASLTTNSEDDDMSTTSTNGRAGLSWPAGSRHVVQVTYDPGQGQPDLRVVLVLPTGPWVAPALKPTGGSGVYELPAQFVAECRGVILTGAANGPVFDACAV